MSTTSEPTSRAQAQAQLRRELQGSDEAISDHGDCSSSSPSSSRPWNTDEYPPLNLNCYALKHIAHYYVPGSHGKCVNITSLSRGTFHQIRLLEFEDGWTCIGRFTRDQEENFAVIESECATREYVRKHTNIAVPETYFANFDPTNPVGAPFVLMEQIGGHRLQEVWPALTLDHKLVVIKQLADVVGQLGRLHFDKIGSLTAGGTIGPLQNLAVPYDLPGRGPFDTPEEYFMSFLADEAGVRKEIVAMYPAIREKLQHILAQNRGDAVLQAPYRLIHADFEVQNMLFEWDSPDVAPKLTRIIDWDNSYTGPMYYLYDYPIFIQDTDHEEGLWTQNRKLRKEFVRLLAQQWPKDSKERRDVRGCFRQKSYALNAFNTSFASSNWNDAESELSVVRRYLAGLTTPDQYHRPYGGTAYWEEDSELDSDDEERH